MRSNILNGEKKISIREGHRDYRPGPAMLCCHLVPWAVMADITDVRHTILTGVTEEEFRADGYKSFQQMLEDLQQFYPKLECISPVTVIRWDNVRGFLVDNK